MSIPQSRLAAFPAERLPTVRVNMRPATTADLKAIIGIEADCEPRDRWNREAFAGLASHCQAYGTVAERSGIILGHMVVDVRPTQLVLLRLAVRADYQRCGIGRQLIVGLASCLRPQGRQSIACCVRESNVTAQLFLRSMGFRWVETHAGWFNAAGDTGEDGYRMIFELHEASR